MITTKTPHWNELIAQSENRTEFIQRTIEQIEKDFNRAGYPIVLHISTTEHAKQEILTQLTNTLKEIGPSLLPTLIYLVDLPETLFNNLHPGESSYCLELAELILFREAHKIFLRQKYV